MIGAADLTDILIDAELVRRLVAAQFPQWAGLPVTPVEPGGWDNRTFRLGDGLAVRLPSAARYAAQVAKEHRWLPRLAPRLPLPIPQPVAEGRPGEDYPWPWSVRRWLEGEPALAAAPQDAIAFARDLGGFLEALYAIDAADGPPAGVHNFFRGGPLAVYDGEARDAIAALRGQLDPGLASEAWQAALSTDWKRPPVWVHGDVAAGNLLLRDGRLAAVIDFGSAAVGDPACDLAIAWTMLGGEARETFRRALPHDPGTWARGRGWTLWKALITLAAPPGPQDGWRPAARRALDAVLAEHRRLR